MGDAARQDRPAAPRGTFRLGRIADSDVLVSRSWFLVAALIAVVMAPRVDQVQPGLGPWKYVAGLVFAVLLYLSVLLHEASHAIAARHYGYRVSSITLHFLGGMTAIEEESRRPRHEFVISVVGPLTSIAVGAAAVGLWFVTPGGLIQLSVEALAFANLLVGLLNLVPGLPLDGGRALQAGVWKLTGSRERGTVVAGWAGRVVAFAVLGWPILVAELLGTEPRLLDFALAGVVAAFLWTGASAVLAHARLRSRMPRLDVRALARPLLLVPVDVSVAEAVRRAQAAAAGGIVTVDQDGRPVGILSEAALRRMPEDRRPWAAVGTLTRTIAPELVLPADLAGESLLTTLQQNPATEYLLVEPDGSPYGVLSVHDVDRALRAG
ncbi:M50 family metallopeptidase [Nocardioides zeae]|uniref:Zinc metalloprotease n=1 Tax=Nocardioides imazamoxiresistens TaxID=3231893 RepID=A0ABU3PSV7_9ACTN|nr:M50 family metallopeptidase [Nocardioides zeae]MDT9592314.1 M50 family metallopeptidase [Nocardioides zeae]